MWVRLSGKNYRVATLQDISNVPKLKKINSSYLSKDSDYRKALLLKLTVKDSR